MNNNSNTNIPDATICVKCMVFYGNPKTNNLCSGCFRNTQTDEKDKDSMSFISSSENLNLSPDVNTENSVKISEDVKKIVKIIEAPVSNRPIQVK